ncbi:uncharacterized protein [Nicotiana sylvestris]|uniref:uncharacterized protein n=1 Tax=Nicotiana sylvestris TaxID=4096 RepID=UPI00388CEC8E
MAQAFARHFQYNIDIVPDCLSLTKVEKKPSEIFREYEFRWREQAARVNPPMEEDEMMEEMVEEGLKSSKIMSYSTIKATTQAIQSGNGSLLGKKKKEDVAMVVSRSWHGQRGHDIEKCWHLKRAIQELIDTNQIVVQSLDAPNLNQNPLTAHAEMHMIEIVHKDREPKKYSMSVMMIRASECNLVKASDSTKAKPLIVEGVTEKPSSKPPVLVVKGLSKDIGVSPGSSKVVVPWISRKEIEEEVNESGGLTRSGRCFTPEELRKAKPFKDSQMPVKKSVTEELMKVQDYSIVEQLRKAPAQICLLSLLIHSNEHRKIGTERIHLNSVCVRGFDGGGKDFVGDIMLELSIGPVEFTMEFQVLDVAVSYNLLLGRPWIHAAKAVPSSLHQMVKFEWDRQEIVVHGDEDLSACNDTIVPFIEAKDDKGPWVYQTFKTVSVEKIPEGKCIPGPKLSSVSIMVANEMLKNGFVLGKEKDVKRVKNLKQKVWSLPKPVPHISKSFVKPGTEKPPTSSIPKLVVDVDEELIKRFQSLFEEVNMVEVGEGFSKADVQLVGPNLKLSNWEATPLPTRKEFW